MNLPWKKNSTGPNLSRLGPVEFSTDCANLESLDWMQSGQTGFSRVTLFILFILIFTFNSIANASLGFL